MGVHRTTESDKDKDDHEIENHAHRAPYVNPAPCAQPAPYVNPAQHARPSQSGGPNRRSPASPSPGTM